MSSLGLTLLILIVIAIGGLAAFNFWSQRRDRSGSLLDDSVAMPEPGERTEPSLGGADSPASRSGSGLPADWTADQSEPASTATVPDYTWAPEVPGPATEEPAEPALKMPSWATGDDKPGAADAASTDSADAPAFGAALDKANAAPDMQEWLAAARRDLAGGAASEPVAAEPAAPVDEAACGAEPETSQQGSGPLSDQEIDEKLDFDITEEGPEPALSESSKPVAADGYADADDQDAADSEPTVGEAAEPAAAGSDEHDSIRAESDMAGANAQAADGASDTEPDDVANNFFTTVNLDLPEPVAGHTLLRVTDGFSTTGTKPVWISAGERIDSGTVRTALIEPEQSYSLLRFDLLQVNRDGPLDGVEYSEFVRRVNDIAEELGVLANTPDMNIVLIRSRVLDAEVASLDAQVAVNVEAEEPISIERFNDCAGQLRLRPTADGSYLNVDASGAVLNTVSLDVEANRIVLVLDVPTVPANLEPIRKMVECAWKFAQAVDGQMIDDNGRLINNALFERIESQIDMHYGALQAAGLTAGTELTRQVYNSDHDVAPPPPPVGQG